MNTIPGTEAGHSYKVAFVSEGVTVAYRRVTNDMWSIRLEGAPSHPFLTKVLPMKSSTHTSLATNDLEKAIAMLQQALHSTALDSPLDANYTGEEFPSIENVDWDKLTKDIEGV